MAFAAIHENKRNFIKPSGQAFFAMGVSYQGYFDRAWQVWESSKFSPTLIKRDFGKIATAGLNTVRLFISSALTNDLQADDFDKLDQVLQIAAEYQLLVLVTLNDGHNLNLTQVSDLDAKIVERYQYDPVILGWDLENEPRFYHFAAAIYPKDEPPPIQTNVLVQHYQPRISQQAALTLQVQRRIPAHLNPPQAFYYINALQYFRDFSQAAEVWAAQTGKTVIDYMNSTEAEYWHKLIAVLSETVAAWLKIRHSAVRQADPNHLITIGYSWPYFAALPANQLLDFQQFHHLGAASLTQFQQTCRQLRSLQKIFPDHPLMLGQYGYSNQTSPNPATSQVVSEDVTALFEAATLTHLRANQFAGGLKWLLNDIDGITNPVEANFGIYRIGDHPKPIRELCAHFQRSWATPPTPATIRLIQDPIGLAMRFDIQDQIHLSGGTFQDENVSWQAKKIAHCFIKREADKRTMLVKSQGQGRLTLIPQALIPDSPENTSIILYRLINDKPVQEHHFSPNEPVTWTVAPDSLYRLVVDQSSVSPLQEEAPIIVPNAGEHVLLLPNADIALHLALPYIRKFAPDLSFTPQQIIGRWPYVTVLATQAEIPDSVLEAIEMSGAHIVERITSPSQSETTRILADLVKDGRRFRLSSPALPLGDLPADAALSPSTDSVELYIVQPGDSLSHIAQQVYGQSQLWSLIFEANRDILEAPNLLHPGMGLRLPPQA